MEYLSAKTNDKIKQAVSLRDSSKVRHESGEIFLEGARLCSDAAENSIKIVRAFFSTKAIKKYPSYVKKITDVCDECYEISSSLAEKLSDTQSTQGIFCICKISEKKVDTNSMNLDGKYIFLESVQDPSNLGAVSRTAEALGIDGVIVSGGCDIYNPKALRASMGSALRLNVMTCDNPPEFLSLVGEKGMLTLASTPSKDSVKITDTDMSQGVICVVGNEGNGITDETMNACKMKITIPMAGRAESLNASTAAAILIWEMVRK